MKTKLKQRLAISTVLTTVIILVSSVVLGSGVVLYGTSLFQSSTAQESIAVSGVKMWVHTESDDGLAWGAAKVRNTGDKVLSVDKISIRGVDIPFTQWYPDTTIVPNTFQQALNHSGWAGETQYNGQKGMLIQEGSCSGSEHVQQDLVGDGAAASTVCANAASGPVSLSPGDSGIIYFKLTNGTLSALDSGVNTSVNLFAGGAGAPQSVTITGVTP